MMNTQKKNKGQHHNRTRHSAPAQEGKKVESKSWWKRATSWVAKPFRKVASVLRRTWGRVTATMSRTWFKARRAMYRNRAGRMVMKTITTARMMTPVVRGAVTKIGAIFLAASYVLALTLAPVSVLVVTTMVAAALLVFATLLGALEKVAPRSKVAQFVLAVVDVVIKVIDIAYEVGCFAFIGATIANMGIVFGSVFTLCMGALAYFEAKERAFNQPYDADGELNQTVYADTGKPVEGQGGIGPDPFRKGRKATGPIIDLTT